MKLLIKEWLKSHGKCPHCGQQLGAPGSEHTCS